MDPEFTLHGTRGYPIPKPKPSIAEIFPTALKIKLKI